LAVVLAFLEAVFFDFLLDDFTVAFLPEILADRFKVPIVFVVVFFSSDENMFGRRRCLKWERRNARYEQMTSAVAPITDMQRLLRHVRFVPILLQKSKVASVRIFGETLKRQAIYDSDNLSRVTEVAYEFSVRR
jgi:hypothetical protein